MDKYSDVNHELSDIVGKKAALFSNCSISVQTLTFMKLRDILYGTGDILYENLEKQIYVATIKSGFFNLHYATLAIMLTGEELVVACYSQEGLIKQHTAEKAIASLKNALRAYVVQNEEEA